MGYHRPVSHFNIGKKSEHYSRKHFTECAASNAAFIERYIVNPAPMNSSNQTIPSPVS